MKLSLLKLTILYPARRISVYVWGKGFPQTKYQLVQSSTVIDEDKLISRYALLKLHGVAIFIALAVPIFTFKHHKCSESIGRLSDSLYGM